MASGYWNSAVNAMHKTQSAFQMAGGYTSSIRNTWTGMRFEKGVREAFGFQSKIRGSKLISEGFLGRKAAQGGLRSMGIGTIAMRSIAPLMIGVSAIQGYREGGLYGAAKNVAIDAALWGATEVGLGLAGGLVGLAMPAALGYGAYALGEKAHKFKKGLKNVEMGGSINDPFGTAATMRQRSLQALQNNHINGRLQLGNEASIIHS